MTAWRSVLDIDYPSYKDAKEGKATYEQVGLDIIKSLKYNMEKKYLVEDEDLKKIQEVLKGIKTGEDFEKVMEDLEKWGFKNCRLCIMFSERDE
jgi:hypothetical protein